LLVGKREDRGFAAVRRAASLLDGRFGFASLE